MKLKITVENKTYEVEVEAAEPEAPTAGIVHRSVESSTARPSAPAPAVQPASPDAGASHADEAKVCRSPISGIVVKLTAQTGQSVQAGEPLVTLEAMKMETNITAPVNGKIAKINVSVGEGVQAGQVVLEFE